MRDALQARDARTTDFGFYAGHSIFASFDAVSELVIEETPAPPRAVYRGDDLLVVRYRDADEAWVAAHAKGWRSFPPLHAEQLEIRRDANLLVIGARGRVDAAIARLH